MADDPNPDDLPDDQIDDAADDAAETIDDDTDGDIDGDDTTEEGVDAAADDADDTSDQDADLEPPRRQSRGANLRHRAQEAEREAKELKDRLDRLERAQQQPRGQSEADRLRAQQEEDARVSTMTPQEQIAFYRDKDRRDFEGRFAQSERRTSAFHDKASFDGFLARNPRYERYASEVETRFGRVMESGGFLGREAILKFLVGEAVMKQSPKAADKQRRAAQTRRAAQNTKPGSARSDVPAARGRQGKTAADRLKDVTF